MASDRQPRSRAFLRVVLVSPDAELAARIAGALATLAQRAVARFETELSVTEAPAASALLNGMLARSAALFASVGAPVELRFDHLRELPDAASPPSEVPGLCFVDSALLEPSDAVALEREAAQVCVRVGSRLESCVLATRPIRYDSPVPSPFRLFAGSYARVAELSRGAEAELVVSRVLDCIQAELVRGRSSNTSRPSVALAKLIHRFMAERYFGEWGFHYLTGSPISAFVNDLEVLASRDGVACLRGASEHSLACGAFANWRLFQRPFVIAVTKGMMDEFRGTLSNLQQSGARGFIVAADDVPETWFGAQASITPVEDIRDVLRARRLPHVLLRSTETFLEDVEQAFQLFEHAEGPLVLLATAQVLAHRVSDADAARVPVFPALPPVEVACEEFSDLEQKFEQVVDIVNNQPLHLLWQIGSPLSKKELRLVLQIADSAGIALATSCTSPGAVPHYQQGRKVSNLLGSVGVYTFSRAYYEFLFEAGRPNHDQVVFFLKSKLSGAERPLSDATIKADFRVVQVNKNPAHLAPFAEIGLAMPLLSFLERLAARLKVEPGVHELRQRKLGAIRDRHEPDLIDAQGGLPMTTNYFMTRLGGLVERLIRERGYDFIGVNGVSRVGFSMVRNVPLVRPGFSGIYGRGLMGDALSALGTLAFTANANLLAVVGDGERNLVPDILPSLIENLLHGNKPIRDNVTVFIGCNTLYSMIETYLNLCNTSNSTHNRQAANVNLLPADGEFEFGSVRICQRLLHGFDEEYLASALTAPARVNFFPVILAHNDVGDGMTLASMNDWRYSGPLES